MFVLEVLNITLVAVGKSLFSIPFLLSVIIVYFFSKKVRRVDLYNIDNKGNKFWNFFESIMHGLLAGIFVSIVITFIGLPIQLSVYLLLLLPISILLSFIDNRFVCFSYSATVLGVLSLILNGQTIGNVELPLLEIDTVGLLVIVGMLHFIEGILVLLSGHKNPTIIISKKNDEVIQGHILHKYWPIPFALLCMTAINDISGTVIEMPVWWPLFLGDKTVIENISLFLLPFMGIIGYQSISFSFTPKQRAKKSGSLLILYSLILIALAILSRKYNVIAIISLLLMPIMHELMMLKESLEEKKSEPLLVLPHQGVRVMSVIQGSVGDLIGFELGDVILRINSVIIENNKHFKEVFLATSRISHEYIFEVISIDNKKKLIRYHVEDQGVNLGVRLLPDNPRYIYKTGS